MTTENEEFIIAMRAATDALTPLTDAEKAQAIAAKAAADKLATVTSALNNTATALKTFGSTLAAGDTSLKTLSAGVDLMKAATDGLIKKFLKETPILGAVLKEGSALTAAGTKMLLGELDALGKTFNEFGQIGALGSKGMQGLIDDFNKSGLTMSSYKKVVSENTVALARFRGSVKDGISEFAEISGVLTKTNLGEPLRMLGLNLEQVGETAADYVALQTRLGRSQTMSVGELARGTVEYAKNLDELSKVTGANKKTLQAQQDAALTETRFRSRLVLMNNDVLEKSALRLNSYITNTLGDEASLGFRELFASQGAATTEASKALVNSIPGIQNAIMEVQAGTMKPEVVVKMMQDGLKSTQTQRAQFQSQAGKGPFLDMAKTAEFVTADLSKLGEKTQKVIDSQIKGDEDTKNLTKNVVSAQKAMETMAIEMQKGINKTLPAAGAIVSYFTTAMTKATLGILGLGYDDREDNKESITNKEGEGGRTSVTEGGAAVNVMRPRTRAPAAPQTSAPTSAAPAASAAPSTPIANAILNIKSAESTAGGDAVPELLTLAHKIQNMYPGARFTALNDTYHQKNYPDSLHAQGKALDFTLPGRRSPAAGAAIVASLRSMGFAYAADEYAKLSPGGTGGHFHAQLAAEKGGILSGPRSGYSATLHGTEAVVPLPDGRSIPVSNSGGGGSMEIQAAQLNALEELVSAMKNQVNISSKMLQYSQ